MYLLLFHQLDAHDIDSVNHLVLLTVSYEIVKYLHCRVMALLRDLWPSQDCREPNEVKDDNPA